MAYHGVTLVDGMTASAGHISRDDADALQVPVGVIGRGFQSVPGFGNDEAIGSVSEPTPENLEQLEELLSRPSDAVVRSLAKLDGDLIILGVGGKMGPSLARQARRAFDAAGVTRRVIGVSRFSQPGLREQLQTWGIETRDCDLLNEQQVGQLPQVANVIAMTGMKFGAADQPARTWAMNCYLPAIYMRHFRQSRFAVFSSGNVYGLAPFAGGGSRETDAVRPVGEYAVTVLGRERMVEYFSRELALPTVILRLNYAVELRYGVLVDLACKVFAGEPIDLAMGYTNVIWQTEANALALQALELASCPPTVLNLAGPELLSVRAIAERFAQLLGKRAVLRGEPAPDAFLNNGSKAHDWFGRPQVSAEQMMVWIADWVARGGANLGKPTHFENRAGTY